MFLAVPEEIKYAVDSAYKEFNNWSRIAVENRAAILERMQLMSLKITDLSYMPCLSKKEENLFMMQ